MVNWVAFSVEALLPRNKGRVIFYKKPKIVKTGDLFKKVRYYFNLKKFLGLYSILQVYKFIKTNIVLSFFLLIAFLVLQSLLTVSLLLLFWCFRVVVYGENLIEVLGYLIKAMEKSISNKIIWVEFGHFFINGVKTDLLRAALKNVDNSQLRALMDISQRQLTKDHKESSQGDKFNDYYGCKVTRKAIDGISLTIKDGKTLNEGGLFDEFGKNEIIRAANIIKYRYERTLINELLLGSDSYYEPKTEFKMVQSFKDPHSEHLFSNLGSNLIMSLGSNITTQHHRDDLVEIVASPFHRTKHSHSPFIAI